MNPTTRKLRGHTFQGAAAERREVGARPLPRRTQYHGDGRGARPELVRVSTPQGERIAGAFVQRDGEEVFEKVADSRRHMLRLPCEAWAVDTGALAEAIRRGVGRVVIRDRQRGIWWADVRDFEEHGVPINRGHGGQLALGLNWFSFVPHDSVTASQFSLFAEAGR